MASGAAAIMNERRGWREDGAGERVGTQPEAAPLPLLPLPLANGFRSIRRFSITLSCAMLRYGGSCHRRQEEGKMGWECEYSLYNSTMSNSLAEHI